MAERLGKGLQNLLQRFDSASDLQKNGVAHKQHRFFCCAVGGRYRAFTHRTEAAMLPVAKLAVTGAPVALIRR